MKTAIMVDAACDLPVEFCKQNDIHIIPMGVVFGDKRYFDDREPETTRSFYMDYSHFRARDVHSVPPSIDVICSYFYDNIVEHYDQALLMCLSGNRSNFYKYAIEAGKQVVDEVQERNSAGNGKCRLKSLRIMDTQTLFTGQALLAYEAFRVTSVVDSVAIKELYHMLRTLSNNIRVYTVPDDLYYIRSRASLRGENSLGTLSYAMGKSFDIKPIIQMHDGNTKRVGWGKGFGDAVTRTFAQVKKDIKPGLMINAIMISYAGSTKEVMVLDCFRDLQEHADREGINLYLSMMSTAAGINVGPGALSVACCG